MARTFTGGSGGTNTGRMFVTLKDIKEFLEVDSVGYLSLEGMLSCALLPKDHFCTACWAGKYPVPVDITLNKFCMERYQLYMFEGFTTANE